MDKRNCHILIVGGQTSALESREYDVLLIDLNYTRDTTSGHEGLDLPARPVTQIAIDEVWPS